MVMPPSASMMVLGSSWNQGMAASLPSSFFLCCFDEGLGFFEEGEVFFVVRGFRAFDDDPLFHGSLAHGQEGDFVSFQKSGDSFFGQLQCYARTRAAGEGKNFFAGK